MCHGIVPFVNDNQITVHHTVMRSTANPARKVHAEIKNERREEVSGWSKCKKTPERVFFNQKYGLLLRCGVCGFTLLSFFFGVCTVSAKKNKKFVFLQYLEKC